jgi:mRNA interferase RelE/StbE
LTYALHFVETSIADLNRLGTAEARRMLLKLVWLADNCEQLKHEALEGPLAGAFKFRVGDYRAIYFLDHGRREIVVRGIDHRSRSYERR